MSDDLVKRLWSKIIVHTDAAVWMMEAADRIEELEKQNASLEAKLAVVSHNATAFGHKIVSLESARDKAWKTCLDATTKGMELEAKLAIAVNALEDVNTFGDCGLQHIVRPALAKIKGEQP